MWDSIKMDHKVMDVRVCNCFIWIRLGSSAGSVSICSLKGEFLEQLKESQPFKKVCTPWS
jgi:hypothetical protein